MKNLIVVLVFLTSFVPNLVYGQEKEDGLKISATEVWISNLWQVHSGIGDSRMAVEFTASTGNIELSGYMVAKNDDTNIKGWDITITTSKGAFYVGKTVGVSTWLHSPLPSDPASMFLTRAQDELSVFGNVLLGFRSNMGLSLSVSEKGGEYQYQANWKKGWLNAGIWSGGPDGSGVVVATNSELISTINTVNRNNLSNTLLIKGFGMTFFSDSIYNRRKNMLKDIEIGGFDTFKLNKNLNLLLCASYCTGEKLNGYLRGYVWVTWRM